MPKLLTRTQTRLCFCLRQWSRSISLTRCHTW